MKKILLAFSITALMFAGPALAQHTTPRYGVPPQDNTLAGMTASDFKLTDGTGVDTVKVYPNNFINNVRFTTANLNDTVVVKITNLSGSYYGDEMNFNITASSDTGKRPLLHLMVTSGFSVVTTDSLMLMTATTLGTSKRGNMRFIFDGAKWCEVGPTGTARIKQ